MLYAITATPGSGKTLFALSLLQKRSIAEPDRQIYYFGIPQLKFDWIELTQDQVENWWELPEGSIILIDEAQRIFPTRAASQKPPQRCTEFETHRHRGLDIYLITQDPTLLDAHVRKLIGHHYSLYRAFGRNGATVWEADKLIDLKDSRDRKMAVKSNFQYPKKLFDQYKSATVHTHKRKLPLKLILVPLSIFIVMGIGSYGYSFIKNLGKKTSDTSSGLIQSKQLPVPVSSHPLAFCSHITFSGSFSGSQSRYFFNCEIDDEKFNTYEFTRDLQPLGYAIQINKYKASLKYLDKILSM